MNFARQLISLICLFTCFGLQGLAMDNAKPTAAQAQAFMDKAEASLLNLVIEAGRIQWVNANFITYDTELLAAKANERFTVEAVRLAKEATRYDGLVLSADLARKFKLLKLGTTLPTPADPTKAEELSKLVTEMEGIYGRGKYCPDGGECLDLGELSRILADSRDPKQLKMAWVGWRTVSPELRNRFARMVELGNEGARDLGFKDLSELWCSKYDMDPKAFQAELDRNWEQVKPFYQKLHAYVRMRLREHYGPELVPEKGPIPSQLLGNMWAQEWGSIYPLVAPKDADPGFDLNQILVERKVKPVEMVKYGENFFSSLGFAPLPQSFWERSLFSKPQDRDVVCHASAWCIDYKDDLRIKMCIEPTAEDFTTIHHELGHNYYQRAYNHLPFLFQDSANDGFHEAIGDTIALSITPKYLVQLGFIQSEPDLSKDMGLLLRQALDKIAFLPFGLMIDQWRWKVFSGEIKPEDYNKSWWQLVEKYQGVAPATPRDESQFDPGAKYHVAANVPYTRYFLARLLQFQLHRALVKEAGVTGPLNRASIYGSKKAGDRLQSLLEAGVSKPWQESLQAATGESRIDGGAILDYFKPLEAWLDQQLKGQPIGW